MKKEDFVGETHFMSGGHVWKILSLGDESIEAEHVASGTKGFVLYRDTVLMPKQEQRSFGIINEENKTGVTSTKAKVFKKKPKQPKGRKSIF